MRCPVRFFFIYLSLHKKRLFCLWETPCQGLMIYLFLKHHHLLTHWSAVLLCRGIPQRTPAPFFSVLLGFATLLPVSWPVLEGRSLLCLTSVWSGCAAVWVICGLCMVQIAGRFMNGALRSFSGGSWTFCDFQQSGTGKKGRLEALYDYDKTNETIRSVICRLCRLQLWCWSSWAHTSPKRPNHCDLSFTVALHSSWSVTSWWLY